MCCSPAHDSTSGPTAPDGACRVRSDPEGATLVLHGEIDLATRPHLDSLLGAVRAAQVDGEDLLVDARDVTFIDCAGWSGVVALAGGRDRVRLVAPSPAMALLVRAVGALEARPPATAGGDGGLVD